MSIIEEQKSNLPEYSVSEISYALKATLEERFSYVRVRGEISSFKRAASGHVYFNLKDEESVLNAICWKGSSGKLNFNPEDGVEVVCTGKITAYPGRSNYQIIVERMEIAGVGALMALLEKRKKQFAAEGLFDASRKKPLPYLPQVIAVVTSPTGAVIRDILHRLSERFPVHVLVWPVLVQGEGAKEQIAAAIEGFNKLEGISKPDVMIVARGGGSLEDLWAFNEEMVVRAVAASEIPVISAVGHETDTTLIDFVADKRAPTPTAAAEMAVPVRAELLSYVIDLKKRIFSGIIRSLEEKRSSVLAAARGLTNPRQMVEVMSQKLDDLAERLSLSIPKLLDRKKEKLGMLAPNAGFVIKNIEVKSHVISASGEKMRLIIFGIMETRKNRLERIILRSSVLTQLIKKTEDSISAISRLLESFHYKNILARGFALVRDSRGGLITSAGSVIPGMILDIEFSDGRKEAIVEHFDQSGDSKMPNNSAKKHKRTIVPQDQSSLF